MAGGCKVPGLLVYGAYGSQPVRRCLEAANFSGFSNLTKKMILLTSSAVSTLVSTLIILISTFVLFLAGYQLQQNSIQVLQKRLREERQDYYANYGNPIFNSRQPAAADNDGDQSGLPRVYIPPEDVPNSSVGRGQPSGKKIAHLQLLRYPSTSEFCSALLYFDMLACNGTIDSDRILVYPSSLETRMLTEDVYDILNRLQARDVILHAVAAPGMWGRAPAESKILESAAPKLVRYDQIFYLRAPGIILDVERLDNYFLRKPMTPENLLKERQKYKKSKGTTDSINFGQTWLTSRLSMSMTQLPAVFMTNRQYRADGRSVSRAYVPSAEVRRSFVVPSTKVFQSIPDDTLKKPAYVYFERDGDKRVIGHLGLYDLWAKEVRRVCPDVNLDD
ncbi:hypothetical protein KEM54_005828 [Ascosphaera aggregata]|nr:hypothetical protein KEM54_005828 [Ascosphaera aggregata]